MPTATLFPAPPGGLPRSCGLSSASHSTACGALGPPGTKGGKMTFEQRPEKPTAWPTSLLVKAKETVSPCSGARGVGVPSRAHLAPSNRRTCLGVAHVASGVPISETPTAWPLLFTKKASALLPPGSVGRAVRLQFLQTAARHC